MRAKMCDTNAYGHGKEADAIAKMENRNAIEMCSPNILGTWKNEEGIELVYVPNEAAHWLCSGCALLGSLSRCPPPLRLSPGALFTAARLHRRACPSCAADAVAHLASIHPALSTGVDDRGPPQWLCPAHAKQHLATCTRRIHLTGFGTTADAVPILTPFNPDAAREMAFLQMISTRDGCAHAHTHKQRDGWRVLRARCAASEEVEPRPTPR